MMKKSLLILFSAIVLNAQAQCCYTDTYTTSVGWTMNGLSYSIGPNSFNFNATPCDASSGNAFSYATRQLPCTLSDTTWTGDIEFKYTGRGSGGLAHTILAATAGTQNAWNTPS
ncbi:MAG TPA: hypothetical protein VNY73_04290, partial [Bacteroidia bacterium]|nr:hypothetical protein [Bacteroidia bacterium]